MPVKYVHYNKLVRHLVLNEIRENGDVPFSREIKSDKEFLLLLQKKLHEECEEFTQACAGVNMAEIVSEAADMMEVLRRICKVRRIPFRLVEKARLEKLRKKGGYKDRVLLVKVKENNHNE